MAAVIAPPYLVDPEFLISAMLLSMSGLSSSSRGSSHNFSPTPYDELSKF